ncbi:hypothetical protein ABEB36_001218 [Hypothenemus hampei]|uniref:THAP-type domain-containing protein n=1 Tax=Hypothenemus hampei TaxID=57062 RepID=A0ABD1FEH6_HYPHA
MGFICCVPGCSNTSRKGFQMHMIPKDAELYNLWLTNIGRVLLRYCVTGHNGQSEDYEARGGPKEFVFASGPGEIASFRGGLATKSDKRAENVRERAEYRAVVNRGSLRSQVGQIPVKESLFPMEALAPVNYANTRLRSIGHWRKLLRILSNLTEVHNQ